MQDAYKKIKEDRYKKSILIIEDQKYLSHSLSSFLQGKGYHITIASNKEEVLKILETLKDKSNSEYFMVLLDLGLPTSDEGIELANTLRKYLHNTKIIACTGKSDFKLEQHKNIDGVIFKPYSLTTIHNLIKKYHTIKNSPSTFLTR